MISDLVLRGQRVIEPGRSGPASIHIHDGVITAIESYDSSSAGVEMIDAGASAVLPGLVDVHVHLNDPGRTHWEGFATGTRAAAAGGVTTLVDMPLNSIPPATSVEGLRAKLAAAEGNCWVDVGLWGGVVPGNADQIEPLLAEGVLGFKCFLAPSGVDEFPCVSEQDLRKALPILAQSGAVLLAHAELAGPIEFTRPAGSPRAYTTYLASRPRAAENQAIALLVRLSREFGVRTHIVHLSSAEAIPMLLEARRAGLPISVESCPHYLFFTADEVPDGATEFKCAPPIRESDNREQLWSALNSGVIDFIASDHSPCPPEMKAIESGDFFAAWGGIASLQFSLPAVWTAARCRGVTLEQVCHWLSSAPARFAGLGERKGAIAEGFDADFVIFDSDQSIRWPIDIHHRHKLTPYQGRALYGVVERTVLRGETIYCRGSFSPEARGTILRGALYRLNDAPAEDARAAFLRCCGSTEWAARMTSERPYSGMTRLLEHSDRTWRELATEDWLEAFRAHPKIGEPTPAKWSQQEQAGTASASAAVLDELAALNCAYYERFGFIFITCASGKSAEEMVAELRARLQNTPDAELRNAAEQQRLITRLRLRKLLAR